MVTLWKPILACWIGGKAPKIQRSSCAPWWYCKRRIRFLCSIHRARIISITNDSSKSNGCHSKATRVRRTSSWCSICLYTMVQCGRPSRSSWTKSERSSFGRTIMVKAIRESSIGKYGWESSKLRMLFRTPRKRAILVCVCGWHKIGRKETKPWSDVEGTQ